MHMQPLVSPVWSKPLVESTQTIFPSWHLNPVGSESCSFLYPQEQRKMGPFLLSCCKPFLYTFWFSEVLTCTLLAWYGSFGWLCSSFLAGLSPAPCLFTAHKERGTDHSPLSSLVCDGSLSLAIACAMWLWATLLLSASSPSPTIQGCILLALSFMRSSRFHFFPESSPFLRKESEENLCGFLKTNKNYSINMTFE